MSRKLTKEQFDKRDEIAEIADNAKALKRKQTALCKKVYDWQQKDETYAWDTDALYEETGIILVPNVLILTHDDVEVRFTATESENRDGEFGNYTITQHGDLYRIERS